MLISTYYNHYITFPTWFLQAFFIF